MQDAPAAPHASVEMPLKQLPVSSQHPSQLLALQREMLLRGPHAGNAATRKPITAPSASALESCFVMFVLLPDARPEAPVDSTAL
jgi:hypothetical protein